MMLATFLAGLGAGVLLTLSQIGDFKVFGVLGFLILLFMGGYAHSRDISCQR